MEFLKETAFAVKIEWVIDWKRRKGTLKVRGHEQPLTGHEGTMTVYPFNKEGIFTSNVENVNHVRKLALMARVYKFDIMALLDYIANAKSIRPRHIEDVIHTPPYIVKKILQFCLANKLVAYASGGYRKSMDFVSQLTAFKVAFEGDKEKFIPLKERVSDTTVKGEPSMEEYANLDEGSIMLGDEIERVRTALNVKPSHKKLLIKKLEKWKHEAIKIKREKFRDSGLSEAQIAVMMGKDDSDSDIDNDSDHEHDVQPQKKKKRKSELEIFKDIAEDEQELNDSQLETDNEEKEDPSIVRRHFRKKKVK